ncbi:MAG: LemA family protein [Clostridia bacterium]|nr:LemA family protein [Clostridia bacterium]
MTAIIIILSIIIVSIIFIYNGIVSLKNNVKNSKSLIEVYLQQRFDLIPNLVEVAKGYVKHESEVLQNIANLRSSYNATKDSNAMQQLNAEYNNLIGVIEAHPDLKASELFLKLQKALDKTESELQAARRIYNIDVTKYNTRINMFPFNAFAKMFGFKEETLFQADNDARVDVKF